MKIFIRCHISIKCGEWCARNRSLKKLHFKSEVKITSLLLCILCFCANWILSGTAKIPVFMRAFGIGRFTQITPRPRQFYLFFRLSRLDIRGVPTLYAQVSHLPSLLASAWAALLFSMITPQPATRFLLWVSSCFYFEDLNSILFRIFCTCGDS